MSMSDLVYLLPIILVAATSVVVMLVTAFFPYHALVNRLTLAGLVLAMASLAYRARRAGTDHSADRY